MRRAAIRRICSACSSPTISDRIVSSASVGIVKRLIKTTPDNHLAASPHRRVVAPTTGHVGRACNCPAITAGIVSPTCVQRITKFILSTPNDHLTARPDRRVSKSRARSIGVACNGPTISAGIVSPAGVKRETALAPTPNNHFAPGPDCCVKVSTIR